MRFQLSQTTPPHLNRRLQLRMLSFVGLMAIIMFTVGAVTRRPGVSTKPQGISPDSLSFEVRRETFDLKEGEFIAALSDDLATLEDLSPVAEEDLRGQSPRSKSLDDRTPFTTRSKESRKAGRESGSDPVPSGNPLALDVADEFGARTPSRSVSDFDRVPATAAPPAVDDWALDPDFAGSAPARNEPENFIRPIPRHRKPQQLDNSFEDLRTPRLTTDPPPARRDERLPAPSSVDEGDDWNVAPRSRQVKPASGLSTRGPAYDPDERPAAPIELGRRGTVTPFPPSQPEPVDAEIAKPRIDKRYLDRVKDNDIGIRSDESEAFFWLLDHSRRVPPSQLERVSNKDVQYINLMTEPDRYRGEPITIEGDLWRLYELKANRNSYGVARMYEAWIFTGDSSNHPFRVVCTSLPSGIEPGENLRKPVRVTGYFFKKEGYQSNGGVHIAPTILARRININTMPNGIPSTSGILPYMIGAVMAIGLAVLVTIVGFAISDGRSSRAGMDRLRRHPQMSFAGLKIPETVSVESALKQLAEQERNAAVTGAYGPLVSRQSVRTQTLRDRSPSRHLQAEATHQQKRLQTGTLQDWSSRQAAARAEIEALAQTRTATKAASVERADELDFNRLDPARNVLQRDQALSEISTVAPDNDAVSFTLAPTIDQMRLKHETESLWPGETLTSDIAEQSRPAAASNIPEASQVEDESTDDRVRRNRRNWRRGKSA
ncbi:hypothetical protein [Schlesneria sp. T3-172]|uniref:hypothetical protein n=1 Tax=Schlesneria sphaerica TaxID=3373610 RepID=UPI0037C63D15